MGICPKGKISKARRDKRRAQSWKISVPTLISCSKCGNLMRPHYVCKLCGNYNKRSVIDVAVNK